jgi:hypothetical protein
MLIKKPLERRGGDRLRRMPSDLPTLKRLKFCRQSRRNEARNRSSSAFPPTTSPTSSNATPRRAKSPTPSRSEKFDSIRNYCECVWRAQPEQASP